jgi:hypothetical protein
MKREHRDMLLVARGPEAMLERLEAYTAPAVDKFVGMPTRA